jgi:hypothetical protein
MAAGGGGYANFMALPSSERRRRHEAELQERLDATFPPVRRSPIYARTMMKRVDVTELKPGIYFEVYHANIPHVYHNGIVTAVIPHMNHLGQISSVDVDYQDDVYERHAGLSTYVPYTWEKAFYIDMVYEQAMHKGLQSTAAGASIAENSHIVRLLGKHVRNLVHGQGGGRRSTRRHRR